MCHRYETLAAALAPDEAVLAPAEWEQARAAALAAAATPAEGGEPVPPSVYLQAARYAMREALRELGAFVTPGPADVPSVDVSALQGAARDTAEAAARLFESLTEARRGARQEEDRAEEVMSALRDRATSAEEATARASEALSAAEAARRAAEAQLSRVQTEAATVRASLARETHRAVELQGAEDRVKRRADKAAKAAAETEARLQEELQKEQDATAGRQKLLDEAVRAQNVLRRHLSSGRQTAQEKVNLVEARGKVAAEAAAAQLQEAKDRADRLQATLDKERRGNAGEAKLKEQLAAARDELTKERTRAQEAARSAAAFAERVPSFLDQREAAVRTTLQGEFADRERELRQQAIRERDVAVESATRDSWREGRREGLVVALRRPRASALEVPEWHDVEDPAELEEDVQARLRDAGGDHDGFLDP